MAELTRGQKGAQTRARNKAARAALEAQGLAPSGDTPARKPGRPKKTEPVRKGVPSDDLMAFLESLEATRDNAIGFGEFESAVIKADFDGQKVTATYDGREWLVHMS